ncbi:MAG: glycoside hydrolase family 95 protein [Paenibacillus lautus]|uniref:glycosyl hydrolase family 95 catalytic domain-containing protein n=1 Tax=Paenibacillus lautus TaxID=1401 RepID=UPI0026EF574B|nr:glycoside hydrolase N-terminal domain-containing protein [Paenibacillus lautus]MCI1776343.1 glycoside hydrolase family 95 protein [Paenibacillus lautus]
MSQENLLTMRYPASWWRNMWREALPSGNGIVGASVFGGVQEETVLLNHEALWHWGRKDPLPDVSMTLAETRSLMDEGHYMEASWNLANALRERGYGTRLASRFPLAAIKLFMPSTRAFRRYRRSLNMETGEVSVGWTDGPNRYVRRLFVSRADGAVVYEIGSEECANEEVHPEDGKGTGKHIKDQAGACHCISGEIGLTLYPSDRWGDTPEFKKLAKSVVTSAKGAYIRYAGRNDDGTDFGAVLRLICEGGSLQSTKEGTMLNFTKARRVLVLVKVFIRGKREQEWEQLERELKTFPETCKYDLLLKRHTELHGPLFHSASLELNTASRDVRSNEELLLEAYEGEAPVSLVRKMWAYGRYLFICGTAAESGPFGLYGLWGGDYRLVWCHHMANENIQMMYWHAHVGALGELVPPLFRYYGSLMGDFRGNARKLYGCRGIYIPAGTTPGIGTPNQIVPVILNWTGAAGWLARHYYEHFLYTGDIRFLREEALPFMREALQFYEDFAVVDEDGSYRLYPSVSPENTPLNFMPEDGKQQAHPMPTTVNATMDIAIMKELLTHLIEANRLIGGPGSKDEEERWKRMLEHIPPYRTNEDGALAEWLDPKFKDRYDHRHLSHIYPLFPGDEVTRESAPELYVAFEKAVRLRRLGAQSGWSLAHMASIYARLGEGDGALECLDTLAQSCLLPNLFTLHNDWRGMGICMDMPAAPIQLDANMGWVNAVQEMLLQVSPDRVKLLPALPERWRSGRLSGWRFHTGRITMEWNRDAGMFHAKLEAERETNILVSLPPWVEKSSMSGQGAFLQPSSRGPLVYAVRLGAGTQLSIHCSPQVEGDVIGP